MSDQKVPAAPDYSPIINAYNSIASHATDMGNNSMAWAKDQVANNQDLVNHVNSGNLDTQSTFSQAAKDRLAKGQQTADEATNYLQGQRQRYTDPNYVANDMGAAEAGVGQSFDAARNASTQQLESYGVNPGATRFAGLDTGVRMQEAAAKAAAGTNAATLDQQKADAANNGLLTQGNTAIGQSTGLSGTGTNAGQGAVANNLGQTASGSNAMGTDLAWTGVRSNALGGATNATNTGFNNQAKSDEISNSSSSGIGSLLGTGLSAFGSGGAFSSGGALSGIGSSIGSALMAFAEGGVIPDGADGGVIPPGASPSGGAVTDDVPAQAPGVPRIQLNGGEAIIPKDVTTYMGQKFFMDMIAKARKAMQAGMSAPAVGGNAGGNPGGNPPGGQGPMQAVGAVG